MQRVDFAIVCALDEEYEAMVNRFSGGETSEIDGHACYFVRVTNTYAAPLPRTSRVAIVKIGEMGNLASLDCCKTLLRTFSPYHVILAGICGGILRARDDFRVGDVVISTQVLYYEIAKVVHGSTEIRQRGFEAGDATEPTLLRAARDKRTGEWTAEDLIGVARPDGLGREARPRVHEGRVLSGEKVIADEGFLAQLLAKVGDAVSVEMEAAGVAFACHGQRTPFLVVKGVSDPADRSKSDSYRAYACATAASFVYVLLTRAKLPDLPATRSATPPLGDLLRLHLGERATVIMPGYDHDRHKGNGIANYPCNLFESAYDDVYCALRIMPALEAACGPGNVEFAFDKEERIPQNRNMILIGSSVSNVYTKDALVGAYFRYAGAPSDHDIVAPDGAARYAAALVPSTDGRQVFETDFALISVFRSDRVTTVVLGGCRAYGQLMLGDFLADPERTEALVRRVPVGDFQCVLRVAVRGRDYGSGTVESVMVRLSDDEGWTPA